MLANDVAARNLPIMPAVLGIDITVSAAFVHFMSIASIHHYARPAIANRVDFILGERLAFFVFCMNKQSHERGYEDGHEIIGVRFHSASFRITPLVNVGLQAQSTSAFDYPTVLIDLSVTRPVSCRA